MRVSTSTNICAFQRGDKKNSIATCMRMCAEAGYTVLDVNLCEAMNPYSELRTDVWEAYVRGIDRVARSLGVEFVQSHLPYYDVSGASEEKRELYEELIRRSILASGMLGVRWTVAHPVTVAGPATGLKTQVAANLRYFAPHVALARSAGVGIALENDFGVRPGTAEPVFGAAVHELISLADAFSEPGHVGVCYDFGHANLMGSDPREDLRKIGRRLKATHVQDNHGTSDEHLMPFFGTIDWVSAMGGLADIGYEGDLTYEIQEFGRYLPNEHKHLVIEQSLVIGEILMGYFKDARQHGPAHAGEQALAEQENGS